MKSAPKDWKNLKGVAEALAKFLLGNKNLEKFLSQNLQKSFSHPLQCIIAAEALAKFLFKN